MPRPIPFVLLALLLAAAPAARAGEDADSLRVNAAPTMWTTPRYNPVDHLLRVDFAARGSRGASPSLFGPAMPVRTEPLTLLEKTLYGADKGAYTGLALGTLGSWLGLWEEETAWALMGAGAAMGSVFGGLSENAGISIGLGRDRDRDRRR